MKNNIRVETDFYLLRVFINDYLHFQIKIKDIKAIQSFKERKNRFIIEYSLKERDVRCEYQQEADWLEILKQLQNLEIY